MPKVELIVRGGVGEVAEAAKKLDLEQVESEPLPAGPKPEDDPDTGIVRVTLKAEDAGDGAIFELARGLASATGREVEPSLDTAMFRPWGSVEGEGVAPGRAGNRWAVGAIGCPSAWKLSTGAGIKVGHPDTGYVEHPELEGAIEGGYDLIDEDEVPHDVLEGIPPFQFPGHGTGTASVIASREASGSDLVGAAPGATLVPFRVTRTVALFDPARLLRAVRLARNTGCRVISISLGGVFPGSALRDELRVAAQHGTIVVAAAGQPLPFVVEPASYESTIAVAGSTSDNRPWAWSGRGKSVDVCAPAVDVPRAVAKTGGVSGGHGTSFATALTAGVAALWLSHHGGTAPRGASATAAFRALIAQSANRPAGWDTSDFGPGILDAAALMRSPLPQALQEEPSEERSRGARVLTWLSRLLETDVAPLFKARSGVAPEKAAEALGTELAFLAGSDEAVRLELRAAAIGAAGPEAAAIQPPAQRVRRRGSPSLRRLLGD